LGGGFFFQQHQNKKKRKKGPKKFWGIPEGKTDPKGFWTRPKTKKALHTKKSVQRKKRGLKPHGGGDVG